MQLSLILLRSDRVEFIDFVISTDFNELIYLDWDNSKQMYSDVKTYHNIFQKNILSNRRM